MNSRRPVGTVNPPMLNDRKLSRRWPNDVESLMTIVLRRPVPSGQRSSSELNGSTSHAMHISETIENPT